MTGKVIAISKNDSRQGSHLADPAAISAKNCPSMGTPPGPRIHFSDITKTPSHSAAGGDCFNPATIPR